MPTLFLLFSHTLTDDQIADARNSLGVTTFTPLPPELLQLWKQVPAEIDSVHEFAQPIWNWLQAEAKPGDYVLVQGDFGMTFATVNKALDLQLTPLYATTRRESQESVNEAGEVVKTLRFKHIRFRKYTP